MAHETPFLPLGARATSHPHLSSSVSSPNPLKPKTLSCGSCPSALLSPTRHGLAGCHAFCLPAFLLRLKAEIHTVHPRVVLPVHYVITKFPVLRNEHLQPLPESTKLYVSYFATRGTEPEVGKSILQGIDACSLHFRLCRCRRSAQEQQYSIFTSLTIRPWLMGSSSAPTASAYGSCTSYDRSHATPSHNHSDRRTVPVIRALSGAAPQPAPKMRPVGPSNAVPCGETAG